MAGKEDNSNKGNKEPDYDQDEGQLEESKKTLNRRKLTMASSNHYFFDRYRM